MTTGRGARHRGRGGRGRRRSSASRFGDAQNDNASGQESGKDACLRGDNHGGRGRGRGLYARRRSSQGRGSGRGRGAYARRRSQTKEILSPDDAASSAPRMKAAAAARAAQCALCAAHAAHVAATRATEATNLTRRSRTLSQARIADECRSRTGTRARGSSRRRCMKRFSACSKRSTPQLTGKMTRRATSCISDCRSESRGAEIASVLTAGDQLRAVREVSIPQVDWAAAIVSLYRRHFGTELTAESVAEDIFAEQRRQHSGSAGGAAGQGRVRRVAVPQRSQLSAADATCWFRKRNLAFYVLDCQFRVRAFNDPRQDGQSLNEEIYPRCVYALQHPFGHFGAGLPVPRHVPDDGDSDSDNHSAAEGKSTRAAERAHAGWKFTFWKVKIDGVLW